MLDISFNLKRIDMNESNFAKAFSDKQLGSRHMIGRHDRIGGSFGDANCIASQVDDVFAVSVVLTDAAHVTDVMTKQRYNEMQPIAWTDATDVNMTATQNFLSDQRHQYGVVDIVIRRISICDIFQRKPTDKTYDARIIGLEPPVSALIHELKFSDERFNYYLCGIKHCILPQAVRQSISRDP